MESAEQPTNQLHNQIGKELQTMGQPVLEQAQDAADTLAYSVSKEAEKAIAGEGPDTYTRVSPGRRIWRLFLDRLRRKQK